MKVAIVGGAGGVGASVAFNLLLGHGEHDIVLVDRRPEMISSHVWDLEQTLEQAPGGSIRGGDEDDLLDAGIVVLAAATPPPVNTSRLVYLADNAAIVAHTADLLARADAWTGVLLVVTNPVDPLCTFVHRRTGIDRRRIVGYTLNDSLRLRTGVAQVLGVRPGSVDAWAVGEHGDTSVLLFDRITVAGDAVELDAEQRAAVEEYVRTWYARHVALDSGRSSTWTSGLGIARMVGEIADPAGEMWPASVVLSGVYGIDGVAVSVPVSLGPRGVEQIHEWEIDSDDLAALRASAALVRELTDGIEVPAAT